MADLTVDGLTELTAVATNDELGVWDVSAGQYKKITRANLLGGAITGGGTIATGGYTLTIPATGTAALLDTTNLFTVTQTIEVASTVSTALVCDMPESTTGAALRTEYNNTARAYLYALADNNYLRFAGFDNGASVGTSVQMGRNTNASTPAAGFISMFDAGGTQYRVWPDDAGNLRIHNADPTNANDTAGTVVGAQTSMAEAKFLYSELSPIAEVLRRIVDGADAVRSFVYRSGSFNRQRFEGVVTDYAPDYGMDRDEEHPAGKALNEIQIAGDLLRAVAWLSTRVAELERLTPGT